MRGDDGGGSTARHWVESFRLGAGTAAPAAWRGEKGARERLWRVRQARAGGVESESKKGKVVCFD